jgi:hypothetical protein
MRREHREIGEIEEKNRASVSKPPRILLLRSGRHLQVALVALAARFPGVEVAVVGTPGGERAILEAGVAEDRTFIYTGRRFTPVAFFTSRTAAAARRWGYEQVAVLWNDPGGTGQGNVDRTALLLTRRGFLAVTPDGGLVEREGFRQARYESRRARASLVAGLILAALYVPALLFSFPWFAVTALRKLFGRRLRRLFRLLRLQRQGEDALFAADDRR